MPDGSVTPVDLWQGGDRPLVMIWPGFGMGAGYYRPMALSLVEHGFPVAIGELRGQGRSSARADRRNHWGYHDLASVDFPRQIRAVKAGLGVAADYPMVFLSHSMGGQISCLFAAREDAPALGLRGIFGVGAGTPHRPAFDARMGRRLGLGALLLGVVGGGVLGYWPGKVFGRDLVGYGRQSGTHMREWRRFHLHNSLDDLSGSDIDYVERMRLVDLPVLLTRGEDDRDCPEASSRSLASFLPRADVTCENLPGGLGHNRWARQPEVVTSRFLDFVEELG
ncbi:alpha/beta fold hydrolase [Corynebacterium pacaense]|uniref:alpha/beta fold hydrolase n=1 Tax=Corynebacterium pacaense TaxID=1816684 RepID=UPI0009B9E686|nr:alpha/beta fold hydrolase [Corynebacterium pacaense]